MQAGLNYDHQTVMLDGETFSHCEFAACRLVYSGGKPPKFMSCRFTDCEWKFEDAAAQTLSYLKLMWNAGAKPAVQSMIKEITAAARFSEMGIQLADPMTETRSLKKTKH